MRFPLRALPLAGALLVAADAEARRPEPEVTDPSQVWYGPDEVKLDILRPGAHEAERVRIFVQATLPDGEMGTFMVDTGASISAISEKTALRLGLDIDYNVGWIDGLGGRTPFNRTTLPVLQLGDASVPDVDFAVGPAGLMDTMGWMPIDGLIGNNVWSRFAVEIDYPADTMVLHRAGTFKSPRSAAPMNFTDGQVLTLLRLVSDTEPKREGPTIIQVDTGASNLSLSGPSAPPPSFLDPAVYSEGLEPVLGIGAADILPPNAFFRVTRRIPLSEVELGGRTIDVDLSAMWLNYDTGPAIGPSGLVGLAGHELMADYNAIFDYPAGKFALRPSRRKARELSGPAVMLEQDIARHGQTPARSLFRAKMNVASDNLEEADRLLGEFLAQPAPDPVEVGEARVLLAAIRRSRGDLAGAWDALSSLSPADLVRQGQIVAAVNGMILDGQIQKAADLADQAIREYRKEILGDEWELQLAAEAKVSRADAAFGAGDLTRSNNELLDAAKILDNPDAHLLRRARVALARGDRFVARSHFLRLIQLYPSNGQYLWFYATLLDDPAESETFRADMQDAVARLHREDRPLDYLAHAHHLLGEQDLATSFMREGLERDCAPMAEHEQALHDNCTAWYYAMAGVEPDESLRLIESALKAEGDRSDFLDTKGMVLLSRGETDLAYAAALSAARMSPDDLYLLWQAERIGQLAKRPADPVGAR